MVNESNRLGCAATPMEPMLERPPCRAAKAGCGAWKHVGYATPVKLESPLPLSAKLRNFSHGLNSAFFLILALNGIWEGQFFFLFRLHRFTSRLCLRAHIILGGARIIITLPSL